MAIEDIKVGDWVLSKDDLTGKVAFKQVTTLFRNADKLIYELSVVNEQGETEVIGTTAEHPFYVKDKGWTKTIQLLVGDKITTADDNIVTVFAVKLSPTRQDTYNFEVDDYHTYFVGENKLWVHNECFEVVSRIKESKLLVREAENAGKSMQREIDSLTEQLKNGNLNPGTGSKHIGNGIHEARSRNGARVYFRTNGKKLEILGKSTKANQQRVIDEIMRLFGFE